MNKRFSWAAAAAAVLTMVFAGSALAFPKGNTMGAPAAPAAEEKKSDVPPDAPVAVVNGKPILRKDFDFALRSYLNDLARTMGGKHGPNIDANDKIKDELLDQMIESEVLTQEIRKNGGLKDIEKMTEESLAETRKGFPDDESFKAALANQGLDEAMLKELHRRRAEFQAYVEEKIAPTVKVEDADVQKFYDDNPQYFEQPEQVRASHILVAVDKDADKEAKDKARAKADELRKRVRAGEDFAAVATESSDCPSAKDGGDLNFMGRGQTVEPFDKAIFSMKVGELSDIVETQFGFHVIKVTDKKEAGKVPLADVKARIVDHLTRVKTNEKLLALVADLKKSAKIEKVANHI